MKAFYNAIQVANDKGETEIDHPWNEQVIFIKIYH